MSKNKGVFLAAIRRDMQARFHFENRNEAFAILWYGWNRKRERLFGQAYNTKDYRWKRGYISENLANEFWDYICE